MKKIVLTLLLLVVMSLGIIGCGHNKLEGTPILTEHGNVIVTISSGNKDCVTTQLTLYDDNQYELFTSYKDCRPGELCTNELNYTKSIKGTYDYDVIKIIETSTNANDKTYSMDNLPEYVLYLGENYIKKYDTVTFTVEKGKTNKYLEEFLKQEDINLNQCASPDYVK